jgi:hypothetical protein
MLVADPNEPNHPIEPDLFNPVGGVRGGHLGLRPPTCDVWADFSAPYKNSSTFEEFTAAGGALKWMKKSAESAGCRWKLSWSW